MAVIGAMVIAGGSALSASSSAKKQRKAMERAQRQSRIDLAKSLAEAKQQLGPYSEIGTRDGLYKLASLMGDDRFGSQEAMDLYELAPPPEPEAAYAPLVYDPTTQTMVTVHSQKVAEYNKRKSDLEALVAKQKAEGNYRPTGFDYISGTEAYKNRLNEGQRNMLRGMSANRGVLSGGALKDMEKYGQDYAANEYNQEFQRLSTMAGLGQNASTAIANAAMGQGTNLANLALAGGTTAANYYDNQNNVTQGTLGNLAYLNERKRDSSYRNRLNSGVSMYEEGMR